MKQFNFFTGLISLSLFFLVSCDGGKGRLIMTPTATGSAYEVLVVADHEDFKNGAYDALYEVLTDDIFGLPQSEAFFKVSRTEVADFSRTLRYCRNIIIIKIDDKMFTQPKFKYSRDVYASPQIVMTIQAPDVDQFKEYIEKNGSVILDFFDKVEINREIVLLKEKHHPVVAEKVKSMFGCEIYVPSDMRRMKIAKDFFWATTDNGDKDMNFVIYSYPYTDANTFTPEYFFEKRDSVMKRNIPGPREGQYMITSRPFVRVTDEVVRKGYAQIARGLWEMENYDMGGPFVSVSRVDEKNQRVIVVEGFVYAPGDLKKVLMRRIEPALYTLKLPDEIDAEIFNYFIDEVTINPESDSETTE